MDTNVSKKHEDDDDDLEEDESFSERLAGLTEMFPEPIRNVFGHAGNLVSSAGKTTVWLLRNSLWIACSSAIILVLPVMFESERAQQHEEQLQQQRQILLGPNAAVSGAGSSNLLPGMGMVPPPVAARPSQ